MSGDLLTFELQGCAALGRRVGAPTRDAATARIPMYRDTPMGNANYSLEVVPLLSPCQQGMPCVFRALPVYGVAGVARGQVWSDGSFTKG